MTGSLAFLGKPQAAALRIAADRIKLDFGITVNLLIEDSKGDAKAALSAARKLLNVDRVDVGFVTTSALANTVAPVFAETSTPLFTICSDQSIAVHHTNAVNFYVGIGDEIRALTEALQKRKLTKISFLRVKASVSEDAVRIFKSPTGPSFEIITDTTYDLGRLDVRNDLQKLSADQSEAIIMIGYGPEFPTLLKQLEEVGFQKPIFGNYTFTSAAARSAGTAILEHVIFTAFPLGTKEMNASDFGRTYTELTGEPPSPFLDYVFAYEALLQVGRHMSEKGTLEGLSAAFRGKTFPSLVGPIAVDAHGNANVQMTTATYSRDGSITTNN